MIDKKRVVAITLARGGSKGIPNKNLAVINGKSLLERAIECGKATLVDEHWVSTDSPEILNEAKRLGVQTILRPEELAQDNTPSSAAIAHAIHIIHSSSNTGLYANSAHKFSHLPTDYIVEIMCTSPFKTSQDVDNVIKKLHETKADSVVGVVRIYDHHPARLKYIEDDQLVNFFPEKKESRRQDLEPAAYVRNGSLYAFTHEAFVRYKSRYGGIVRPYIMTDMQSINIDEPMDLTLAQIVGEKYGL